MIESRSKLRTFLTMIGLFAVFTLGSIATTSLASARLKQVVNGREPSEQGRQVLSTVINLRDFGAMGDSVRDDAPALQQALNALADAGGGTLQVPAGHYLLSTPVVKQFLPGQQLSIEGEPSSTVIDVAGNGKGLDLTSEFIVSTGAANDAIQLRGLGSLLMTDVCFVGVQQTLTDAHVVLLLADVGQATIRHCEFYGLASLVAGGAIVAADHTDLRLQQTAFLGCAGNSGVRTSVVQNTSWFGVSVSDCKFVDYGLRPDFWSKTPLAPPYSWIMVGNYADPEATSSRREVVLDNVFLDEGALGALWVLPGLFDAGNPPYDMEIYLSRLYVNVTNLGASGIYIDGPRKVFIDRSHFGWSNHADKAIYLANVGEAVLDLIDCSDDATRIQATAERLTVINSVFTSLDSSGPYTRVITTNTAAEDPAQYVEQQYLLAVNHDADPAGHFYWTTKILRCETDTTCIVKAKTALATYLAQTPPARFSVSGQVLDENGVPIAEASVILTNSHSVITETDVKGNFAFTNLPTAGEYTLVASKKHYSFESEVLVTPTSDQVTNLSGALLRHNISGRVVTDIGDSLSGATLELIGSTVRTTNSDAEGYYVFPDVAAGNNYTLTVARKNYTFAASNIFFPDLSGDQNRDFQGTLLKYTIAGSVRITDETALPNALVTVSGGQVATMTTDQNGNYSFTLDAEKDYVVSVFQPDYTFSPISQSFANFSGNVRADFTGVRRPILISTHDPTRALALDAVLGTAEPFHLSYDNAWGADRRTRLILFATNFELGASEGTTNIQAELEDGAHRIYPLTVEYAASVDGFEWLNHIVVRLNDDLTDVGDILVRIKYRGISSEPLIIGIGHPREEPFQLIRNSVRGNEF